MYHNHDVTFVSFCYQAFSALIYTRTCTWIVYDCIYWLHMFSHTVNYEYQLVVQQLQSLQQVNEAICRVLTSQISGLVSVVTV